jgi:hypothetical protein
MSSITKWDKQAIVKAIMADVPKVDKKKRREELQASVVKLMSPEARKLFKTTPNALRTYHVGDITYDGNWSQRDVVAGDVPNDKIDTLCEKYKEEDKNIREVEYKIKGIVDTCRTIKQLNERLPEFKKYFPTVEKPVANLPAIANVVADLSKLGWPKGASK